MRRIALALATALLAGAAAAEPPGAPPQHDVPAPPAPAAEGTRARPSSTPAAIGLPLKPTRTLAFTTNEGTWLSPDLAPDGRRIVFELLGDLYTLHAKGGRAKPIATGMAFDSQPAFSPDGRRIAFLSDRSGAENLWIADADGRNPRAVTRLDEDAIFTSPTWSADGRTLFVSRYRADHAAFELVSVAVASGAITTLLPIAGDPASSTVGAAASRDGRWLYYAARLGPPDATPPGWVIRRRNLASGAEETLVEPPRSYRPDLVLGTFYRPLPSPDGRLLVYATRYGAEMWLRVLDLESHADRWLVRLHQRDGLESAPWRDLAPHYAFTPDSRAIVVNDGGKLRRVSIANGAAADIPFTVNARIPLGPLNRTVLREETGPVRARVIQQPMMSPDGTRLAFSALGHLYVMPLSGDAPPRRLTDAAIGEYQPGWSPDGRSIAYVRWTAREGGTVWRAPADRSSPPTRVSDITAYYTSPAFTPDGTAIVALRSSDQVRLHRYMEYGPLRDAELVRMPATGGAATVLTRGILGGIPHFGPDPAAVLILSDAGLAAVPLAGGAARTLVRVTGPGYYFQPNRAPADDLRLSPDGKWLLVQLAQQLHLLAMPATTGTVIDLAAPPGAHRRLTEVGADFLQWNADSRTIGWGLGASWFRAALADPAHPVRRDAIVEVPRANATGALLLRGATILTMRGDETIADADLLVMDGRFAAVGVRGSVAVPPGTVVRAAAGKWIVPGFIDDHDHVADIRRGVLDFEPWGVAANLSWGVTTAFDPSTLSIDMLAYQDLIDAGLITGSRIRSTGIALFSFNAFTSKAEVDRVMERYRDFYRLGNVKLYRTGSRRVRQWIVESAREHGLRVAAEGATVDKLDLTQIKYFVSSSEHALPAAPLYRDVVTLLAKSGVAYNTTLMINGGGQDHFIVAEQPNRDPKLNRFAPRFIVDMKTRRRDWRDLADLPFPAYAASAAEVMRAGGIVGIGSHGEVPGLGFHWEMAAHVLGGWTPAEALAAGTIGSARAIGRDADLGSIEPGKVADLVILDRDPRTDIRNARAIAAVMQGGRLYDGETLDETWPVARPFGRPWFRDDHPPGIAVPGEDMSPHHD